MKGDDSSMKKEDNPISSGWLVFILILIVIIAILTILIGAYFFGLLLIVILALFGIFYLFQESNWLTSCKSWLSGQLTIEKFSWSSRDKEKLGNRLQKRNYRSLGK